MQINIFSQVINHSPKAGWTRQAKVITWAHESKIHLISFLIQWMNRAKAIQLSESKFRQVTVIVVWGLPVGTLYLASRFLIRTYHCNLIIVCVCSSNSQGRNHHYRLCNLILLAKTRIHEMPKHLHLYHQGAHCHDHHRHHRHRRHPHVVPSPTCERISLQRRTVSSVFRWL